MLSDGIFFLHDTHTARKTQEFLLKFKWEVWSYTPTALIRHQNWVPNIYLEQGYFSESDVKTVAENWLNGQDVVSAKPG
ncbi:hypothetical protein AVEN_8596-1 [Araneus ventricosus]|uniref:Uncharacterized protein n=1 Tax=Araneus ventricosus TaxID=182803 RepID=A0A4Y2IB25_ARAVE|nr:hypothetical protein AVEN_8596-1 [Araneus ventricosus]